MEKVIITLRDASGDDAWCSRVRSDVARDLLALGVPGLAVAIAIATHSTFGYNQNAVVRALTADAPVIDAMVEESFPIEATRDLHAFFGADQDIDTVPTSRYVFRSPFTGEARP